MLVNFYRYGIGFNNRDMLRKGNTLHIKNFDDDKFKYYIIDRDWYSLKELIYNNVKVIKLEDIDTGEKELTEIEKWKRKVVNEQKSVSDKLTLLNPQVYHDFFEFNLVSKKDKPLNHVIIKYYQTHQGYEDLHKKNLTKCINMKILKK